MAELEEQAAKAQEDAQKGCMGSLLTLGFFLLVGVALVFVITS